MLALQTPRRVEAERRAEPRFPLFLAATARQGSGTTRIQLRNLSRSGALAEALRPPAEGSSVTLARDDLLVQARVAWVEGMRFGLAFDEPIRATDLLVQLSRSRAGS
jgi:hypothetical protein